MKIPQQVRALRAHIQATIPPTEFGERLLLACMLVDSPFCSDEELLLYALLDLQHRSEALYFEECMYHET